ncbi:MAG: ABC transporter permease [Armatimonadota bacterium]|nr:ABC transporter permease [Armatimonadota bacterium]MDR7486682.1 ABC transporter permease [Armatimonadota bacterium]MDR7533728.1 ABC transporter permease [Armatimonadota bacterium]MDR7535065.1 ABC transporter permease [Armatimonadota bacterium]
MQAYVAKRVALLLPTLLGVSVVSFSVVHLIPGDLVTVLLGITASQNEQNRQALIQALHLDRPLAVQYLHWVAAVLQGDLGRSLVHGGSVAAEIRRAYPVTIQLTVMAMTIAVVVGVPLGVLSATPVVGLWAHVVRLTSLLFISTPAFFMGTVLIVLGARYLPAVSTLGYIPFHEAPLASVGHMLPPALALGIAVSAILLRHTRASMLEALAQDYVRTARAKGVTEHRVLFRHALTNALIPVIAVTGLQFVALIGGAVIIEEVFALPGVGRLVVNAIYQRDYTMIQGTVLFLTVNAVLLNLAIDLLYRLVDPRIVYG